VAAGVDEAIAANLAISAIALLEGGFVLSRALRSTEPLKAAGLTATEAARAALATAQTRTRRR
jgi:hypothetical protein